MDFGKYKFKIRRNTLFIHINNGIIAFPSEWKLISCERDGVIKWFRSTTKDKNERTNERTFDVNTRDKIFSPVIPLYNRMRKTSDEIRVADSRKYFHLLQRNKVANIHLAHLIPAFQVILIPSPSSHSWFPFLSIPLATWNAIEEILYCTRFVFEHDSYVFRVYIYIYVYMYYL